MNRRKLLSFLALTPFAAVLPKAKAQADTYENMNGSVYPNEKGLVWAGYGMTLDTYKELNFVPGDIYETVGRLPVGETLIITRAGKGVVTTEHSKTYRGKQ